MVSPSLQAQNQPLCNALPWEAQLTYDVQQWGNESWHDGAAIVSDALLPVTLGLPTLLFTYSHLNNQSVTKYDVNRYMAESSVQLLTAEVATYGVVMLAKALVNRERPFTTYPDCIRGYQDPLGTSFPSGHSAGAAALATTLCLRYPQWYVVAPAIGYALLTGLSRMNLGVHYISDVAAGYAIGVGTALLVHALNDEIFSIAEPLLPHMPIVTSQIHIITITIPL